MATKKPPIDIKEAFRSLPDEAREYFRRMGSEGGKLSGVARMTKLTAEQRSEIARKAVAAREAKRAAEKGAKTPARKVARKKVQKRKVPGE